MYLIFYYSFLVLKINIWESKESPDEEEKYSIREDGYRGLQNIWEQGGEGEAIGQVAFRPVAVHLNSRLTFEVSCH